MSESEIEDVQLISVEAPVLRKEAPKEQERRPEPWEEKDLRPWIQKMIRIEAATQIELRSDLEDCKTPSEARMIYETFLRNKRERKKNWGQEFAHVTWKLSLMMKEKMSEARYVEGGDAYTFPDGQATVKWTWKRNNE
jgi:hypothetical protein